MRNLRQTAQHKGRARSATPLDRSRCILCLRGEHALVRGVIAATVANMVAGTKVRIHGLTGGLYFPQSARALFPGPAPCRDLLAFVGENILSACPH
jgi:hypothetical protein